MECSHVFSLARSLIHLPLPFLVLLTKTKIFFAKQKRYFGINCYCKHSTRNLRSCSYNNNAFISRQTFFGGSARLARKKNHLLRREMNQHKLAVEKSVNVFFFFPSLQIIAKCRIIFDAIIHSN